MPRSFFLCPFAAGGKFGNCCRRRRFARLSARVGVDLRIKDEDIDIAVHGKDMVYAAVADIISPAVAAKDPLGTFDKVDLIFVEVLQRFIAGLFLSREGLSGDRPVHGSLPLHRGGGSSLPWHF